MTWFGSNGGTHVLVTAFGAGGGGGGGGAGEPVVSADQPQFFEVIVRRDVDPETLARALFDWEHSEEAAEKGEAFAGPQQPNGVRMCRDDFDTRMMHALDVMWGLRETDANRARAWAHGMLRMMKLRGSSA